tara:strand:+ start:1774 stop:2481 length:708 start_codon:yes stop_codon:yes gene_type:complete
MTGSMELQLRFQERTNSGTTLTKNEELEKNGYVVVEDFWDPLELYHPLPKERGMIFYSGSIDSFQHNPENTDIPNSLTRYNHPQYEKIFSEVRRKVEKVVNRNLYNTFYVDQFCVSGNIIDKHLGRNAMEIVVEIVVSSNLKEEWPLNIKTPDTYTDDTKQTILIPGDEKSINLKVGSAFIYKGCERPTWRNSLPDNTKKKKLFGKTEEFYHHSCSFHYVLADGERSHCADDMSN